LELFLFWSVNLSSVNVSGAQSTIVLSTYLSTYLPPSPSILFSSLLFSSLPLPLTKQQNYMTTHLPQQHKGSFFLWVPTSFPPSLPPSTCQVSKGLIRYKCDLPGQCVLCCAGGPNPKTHLELWATWLLLLLLLWTVFWQLTDKLQVSYNSHPKGRKEGSKERRKEGVPPWLITKLTWVNN
jgi:hypothetical protein